MFSRTNESRNRSVGALLVAALLLTAAACGDDRDGSDASDSSSAGTTDGVAAARRSCTDHGGDALVARPYWNTNADRELWLELAPTVELCRFESGDPDADETTRIYVDLDTLTSPEPTLAGVAYLSKVPPTLPDQPSANPASVNCTALGGSAQFGGGVSGGGWVTEDRPDEVVDLCVFADRSFIDEFGIFYYAGDVVRGIDLADVMTYQPDRLPRIF